MTATPERYNAVAVFIHWLTALAIIGLLAIGWTMADLPNSDPNKFALFQAHKSVGITVLLLSVFRIVWRILHKVPALDPTTPRWEKVLAHGIQHGFYLLLIVLPLSGWAVVSTSKFTIPTLLYGVIPWPHLPILPTLENKGVIHEGLAETHGVLAAILATLMVLHVAAALKHHFIMRDTTLLRMAPQSLAPFLTRLRK